MNFLFENPLPILAIGSVCAVAAGIIFSARRTLSSLIALAVVLIATIALLVAERIVRTDREQIETGVYAVLDAVESNDLPGLLQWIDPTTGILIRSDAETLMPMMRVETANAAGAVEIRINEANADQATVRFRGFVNGVTKSGGARIGYFDDVELHWTKRDGQWRIESYVVYWQDRPINPVDSVRSNRPVSGR